MEPPCGEATREKPPAEEVPKIVPPRTLSALRVSGETHIEPPETAKTAMLRDGRDIVRGTLKLCLTATGDIGAVSVVRSTGYAAYDARLQVGVRSWRYRPFIVNDRGAPVCGMVTFELTIR
jgi:TonB family protein